MDLRASLGRAAFGARLLLVRLRFVGLMLAVALLVATGDRLARRVGLWLHPAHPRPPGAGPAAGDVEWYCPMDPQVVRAEPAKCPICGMALSKRRRGADAPDLPAGVLARLRLGPRQVALAGVSTVAVERRAVARAIDAVGTLEADERRVARVAARVRGRVERLFVEFTGARVERGAPLAVLWSPELEAATRELALLRPQGGAALEAARRRLERFGLAPEQVAALVERGQPEGSFEVLSPLGGTVVTRAVVPGDYVDEGTTLLAVTDLSALWMVARLDEEDAPLVRLGAAVTIRSPAFPERAFAGHVAFIDPVVDRATRTLGVRVDVPNGPGLLRPGMSVRATLEARLGPDGAVARDATEVVYRCCAACPDVEARAPGPCPRCDMPLMPVERPVGQAFGWECRCPMHPERVWQAAGPGACGLCGRALEPAAGGPGAAPAAPAPGDAGGPGAEVTLYECPGHPEATRDTPGLCLLCGDMELFPRVVPRAEAAAALAGARPGASAPLPGAPAPASGGGPAAGVAPVTSAAGPPRDPLVVPVDAVVDTGERRLVFVESSPGVFDAVEVAVGPRTGDLLPVVAGLREGQRVVARGAFLLDAEVRLAPGAAAQYFGAAGQPGGGAR